MTAVLLFVKDAKPIATLPSQHVVSLPQTLSWTTAMPKHRCPFPIVSMKQLTPLTTSCCHGKSRNGPNKGPNSVSCRFKWRVILLPHMLEQSCWSDPSHWGGLSHAAAQQTHCRGNSCHSETRCEKREHYHNGSLSTTLPDAPGWFARLICKFSTTCPSCNGEANHTENVLHNVLTHGLTDSKIHPALLWDKNQDMSLEVVLQFAEAKEAEKWSTGYLQQSQRLHAAHSQYCSKHNHGKNTHPGLDRVSLLPMAQNVHTANGLTIMRLPVVAPTQHNDPVKVPPVRLNLPTLMPSVQPPASAAVLGRMPSY